MQPKSDRTPGLTPALF